MTLKNINWFHVALVIDQREGQRQHKFYINGAARGSIAEGYEFETGKPKALVNLFSGHFQKLNGTKFYRNAR